MRTWRQFSLVFMIYFGMCFLAGSTLSQASPFLFTALFILAGGIILGTLVTTFTNYEKSMFRNEGYFTLTLPVSSHQLLISKIISSLIWMFIGFGVVLLGIGFMLLMFEGMIPTVNFFSDFSQMFYFRFNSFADILLIINFIFEMGMFITFIFMSITIANSSYIRNHRIFWAVVIFFVCSFIPELIYLIVPNFRDGIASFLNLEGTIYQLVYLLQNVIVFAGIYLITYFALELKVEIY